MSKNGGECVNKKLLLFNIVAVLLLIGVIAAFFMTQSSTDLSPEKLLKKNNDHSYGVSSSNSLAANVGMDVLKEGGNAVDAAIAISYALNVVEPFGSGIGGGGGMLIAKKDQPATFIDYRETAPTSMNGKNGVPGFVAGMEYIQQKYGTKSMNDLIQPAVEYAEKGFEVDSLLSSRLYYSRGRMDVDKLSAFYPKGEAIEEGETLSQPVLAKTLIKIQREGASAFYKGDVAQDLADATPISKKDLSSYQVTETKPVVSTYNGTEMISAPPPFSGITLIQMLKMAEKENLETMPDKEYYETMNRIKKAAYSDRLKQIGDPDFHNQNSSELVSDDYITNLVNHPTRSLGEGDEEHESTTHFVVIDSEGTVVSTTNTLSNFFGTGEQVDGFFLNNNADTFGSKEPNNREPGKRARTFTAPTIIREKGEWAMGIGSPGGTRIPQILTQVLSKNLEGNEPLQEAVNEPRFIFDDSTIYVEPDLNTKNIPSAFRIEKKKSDVFYGGIQALTINFQDKQMEGAGDPRRNGVWKTGD
ncbi:gamma-glutamyltransferase [Priestia megaterium]|nr:gamma-glutamyltransferase [Priestia megaterium]MBT2277665.1 gamma-glutamyltransferase [Priestia megaterium]